MRERNVGGIKRRKGQLGRVGKNKEMKGIK